MNNPADIFRRAIANLEYPSESDTPFEVTEWTGNENAITLVQHHLSPTTKLEQVPFDTFFDELSQTTNAPQFLSLKQLLLQLSTHPTIIRANDGTARIKIFILTPTAPNQWLVLQTSSVET